MYLIVYKIPGQFLRWHAGILHFYTGQETFLQIIYKMDPFSENHRNDIREIKTIKMLAKLNLELDSPRLKEACENLGIEPAELKQK